MAVPPQKNLVKAQIKDQTGVNLEEYRTDLLVDSVMGYVDAPFTILMHFILWPVLCIGLLLYFGIWWVMPLGYLIGSIWVVLGLLLGAITGLAIGAFFIAWNLTDHTKNLFESTLQTIDEIIKDMQMGRVAVPSNRKLPTIGEWLRVVRLAVVVPVIREIIRRKLWPIGDWIGNMATKTLTRSNKRAVATFKMAENPEDADSSDELEAYCRQMLERTQKLRKNTSSIHKVSTALTVKPLRVMMIIFLVIDVLVFWGLWRWL
jgi:hypothetical protein